MFNPMTGENKTRIQNHPITPQSSAKQAKDRLTSLLAHERSLPLPPSETLPFSIKGKNDGLVISFRNAPWSTVIDEMVFYLRHPETRAFFVGARVLLDLDDRRISESELAELIAVLDDNGIAVNEVIGGSAVQPAAETLRSPAPLSHPEKLNLRSPSSQRIGVLLRSENIIAPALVLRRSLHTGEVIRDPRSVVILGNVPSGSELTSDNDIVVFGKLRGIAHAGATGNMTCIIAALQLSPHSLRIGTLSVDKPGALGGSHRIGQIVYARDGIIVTEAWLLDFN